MSRIRANGVELYYEFHGPEDGDVVAISNGVLMSTASWAYQVPALAQKYRLLLYDCRGQWQSEHPPGPYSMEQHADDLDGLLGALGIPSAHLLGISYGAELSLICAYRHPTRVRSLVVASAVSYLDPVLCGIADMWIQAARAHDPELFYRVTYPFNFSARWIASHAELLAAARARYATMDLDAVAALCEAFSHLEITEQLPGVKAPTLVLVGEEDILKPRRYADVIVRAIPHAEYAVIPNAGHALCWEQPDTFNSLVLGFLARH